MRRRTGMLCSLVFGCLILGSCPPPARPDGQDAIDKTNLRLSRESLRGKWLQQSRTANGKRLDDPAGVYLLVTDDGRMRTYSPVESSEGPGPTLVRHVRFRLDATRDPVAIDTAGRADWADVSHGICRLESDTLTLCFAAKNKPRPTRFSTGAGTGTGAVLIVYKRAASDRK